MKHEQADTPTREPTMDDDPRSRSDLPKLLLCDVGDTLVEWTAYDRESGLEAVRPLVDRPERFDREALVQRGTVLDRDLEERASQSLLEFRQADFLRTIFGAEGMRLICDDDHLETLYWRGGLTFLPEEGVTEALERIRGVGVRVGVISNTAFGPDAIGWELSSHGILAFVDGPIVTSARFGMRKPHPTIFHAALGLYGTTADETWYVGNSPYHDVGGAKAAGLGAVWYNADGEEDNAAAAYHAGPDIVVSSWSDLADRIVTASQNRRRTRRERSRDASLVRNRLD